MEWKECTINDVCKLINGRAYSNDEMLESGKYKIVRVGNLSGGNSTWFYSDLELAENKYCHKGDLLFAWACTFGPHIWQEDNTIYHYHIWKVEENKEVIDRKFFYYYLKYATGSFMGALNGSVMVHITKASMEKMPIKIPNDVPTQTRIASILSSLDRKIELNNKINAQLEEMAQAIFKNWFVDFEPFKDGKFVESELGMIPEGWRVGTLGEVIDVKYGKDHKKLQGGSIPVYGSGGLMRHVDKALYEGESVLIPRKGTLNNVMYVNDSFWTVDTMFYSIPKMEDIVLMVYLYLCTKDLASMNAGSAVPSMTTDILNRMCIVIPEQEVCRTFNNVVKQLYTTIKSKQKESLHLSQLRDTLLPKLMSGEIDLDEIEKTI